MTFYSKSVWVLQFIQILSKRLVAVARLVWCPLCMQGCPLCMQAAQRLTLTFFWREFFPSSADSRRASCQLLMKEWALNTGKLPQEEQCS